MSYASVATLTEGFSNICLDCYISTVKRNYGQNIPELKRNDTDIINSRAQLNCSLTERQKLTNF